MEIKKDYYNETLISELKGCCLTCEDIKPGCSCNEWKCFICINFDTELKYCKKIKEKEEKAQICSGRTIISIKSYKTSTYFKKSNQSKLLDFLGGTENGKRI